MTRRPVRQLILIILAAAVLLGACGCTSCSGAWDNIATDIFGEEQQEYTRLTVTLPRHAAYAPITDRTAYDSLKTEAQRKAYLSIEASIFRITEEDGGELGARKLCRALLPELTSGEIFMVKEAVLADHPEAFWLNGSYSLGYNLHDGDYLTMYSSLSAEEIPAKAESIAKRVTELLREIPGGLNEYDRELIIHDCIVRDVEYDLEAAENTSPDDEAATVYGALVGGSAICSGYSRTAKLILNRVGISCAPVKGVSKEVGHMWNLVSIDGAWYHLDVTWDDPVSLSADGIILYDYFNLTDGAIKLDHEIAGGYELLTEAVIESQDEDSLNFYNFDMPACTSLNANFYSRNAISIGQLDANAADTIADAMRTLSASQKDMLYLSFPGSMAAGVISPWLGDTLKEGISRLNREVAQSGGLRRVSRCVHNGGADGRWNNVFIVRFYFE